MLACRGGWLQGRAGGLYPPSEHASPASEGEQLLCRIFLEFIVP